VTDHVIDPFVSFLIGVWFCRVAVAGDVAMALARQPTFTGDHTSIEVAGDFPFPAS
jgi:dipeptide/tripeptide permease